MTQDSKGSNGTGGLLTAIPPLTIIIVFSYFWGAVYYSEQSRILGLNSSMFTIATNEYLLAPWETITWLGITIVAVVSYWWMRGFAALSVFGVVFALVLSIRLSIRWVLRRPLPEKGWSWFLAKAKTLRVEDLFDPDPLKLDSRIPRFVITSAAIMMFFLVGWWHSIVTANNHARTSINNPNKCVIETRDNAYESKLVTIIGDGFIVDTDIDGQPERRVIFRNDIAAIRKLSPGNKPQEGSKAPNPSDPGCSLCQSSD